MSVLSGGLCLLVLLGCTVVCAQEAGEGLAAGFPNDVGIEQHPAVLFAQLFFGEHTVDKTRMLDLFRCNVPDFPMKTAAEHLIHEYVGAKYPDHPPKVDAPVHYIELVRQLHGVVRRIA